MSETVNRPNAPARDLIDRLREAANGADDVAIEELEALLSEAAEAIETLRILVGIRAEVELEDAEPEGRA